MGQKFKVTEDLTVAVGVDDDGKAVERTIKAGTHDVTEKDRAVYDYLEQTGFAEPVKTSTKEG